MSNDMMVDFRLRGHAENRPGKAGKATPGERVLLRVSAMMALFPEHFQIRTVENGWTVDVFEGDWPKVERAFRFAYLGQKVHAAGSQEVRRGRRRG